MYIIGIEPSLPKPHYLSNLHLIRTGLLGLLTNERNRGHQVRAYMEEVKTIRWSELRGEVEKADLVAISTISATQPRGDYFASLCKEMGKLVVMGGPHVTFCPPEESLRFADFVIRYEGELSFPLFIEALEGKRGLNEVPNLVYKAKSGEIIQTSIPPIIPDFNFDSVPFPDFSLIVGWKRSYVTPIETSRGCPFRCKFCCVYKMFPKLRFRSPEVVVEEMKRLNSEFVFFTDDNFCANTERSKGILSLILMKLDRNPRWGAQVRKDVGKDWDFLRLARRTNCTILCIGFESFNPAALEEMNKRQTVEDIKESIAGFKKAGLLKVVHGSFVVGFDSDTTETARINVDEARKIGIPSIQMWILTPLIGTDLAILLKDRLLSQDPGDYDGTKAVFVPAQMTAEELQKSVFKGMKRFYSIKNRLLALLRGVKSLIQHYAADIKNTKNLWKEKFRELGLSWYGRRIVETVEKRAKQYLKGIRKN